MTTQPRHNNAAPPNVSQIEAHEGDVEAAYKEQQGEEDVAKLNEKIAKEQEKQREEQAAARDKRIENGEGVQLGDPLKTERHSPAQFDEKKSDSKK